MASTDIACYPLVEASLLNRLSSQANAMPTTDGMIRLMKQDFDRLGPYEYARREGLLVRNSGEELAIQFMSFYNAYSGTCTY